ncbi:hypothetical protein [Micromonospora sp. NPDC047730]|uniref:hypothetical protein n=1 Tax=Micromonospora sp. NPDC047730 TaxID=3364253 RepID=UPI0037248C12
MTVFRHTNGNALSVGETFDADGELRIDGDYMERAEVVKLRDHLTALLGDAPAVPTGPLTVAAGYGRLTRAEALKLAEETVTRLAPATNARGYADGTAKLAERMDAILRTADYLTGGRA